MDYKEYNDEELLSYIKEQNEEANELMFTKYKPLIKKIAIEHYNKIGNKGLEISDLIQEGMIGLSYAISTYSEDKETSFFTYAKTCIERKILSSLKINNRLKNKILNESIPYEVESSDINLIDVISDETLNPLNIIINYEKEQEIYQIAASTLTELELQVFELKLSGFDYKEISELLKTDYKTIDNALQRIKTKLRKKLKAE